MSSLCTLSRVLLLAAVLGFWTTEAADLPQTVQQLTLGGDTFIANGTVGNGAFSTNETAVTAQSSVGASPVVAGKVYGKANLPIPGKSGGLIGAAGPAGPATLPLPEPVVQSTPVVSTQANGFLGFNGLSHYDQRVAGGNTQFSTEPPDQGLCAANGFVVEAVNNAIRVYNATGGAVVGVDTLNHFFKLAPEIDRTKTPPVIGPFLSDPRCLFDRQTSRWFLTELMQDSGNNPGATGRNFQLIAVSKTSSPAGQWTIFRFDTTDDGLNGTPSHPGCPCFGDQPLIGIDNNGFYVTTNEFYDTLNGFNGAQVYAISKDGLADAAGGGHPPPVLVHINAGPALIPFGGFSYSIQPTLNLPPDGSDDSEDSDAQSSKHGVEYFLSALQFGNPGYEVYDNRIALWALTNSASLGSKAPAVSLSFVVLSSQTYGQPDPAAQKPGPIPLAACLNINCLGVGVPASPNVLEQIQTNDDRMNQVVYSRGLLFSGVNSKLKVDGEDHTGVAWFGVRPLWQGSTLGGRVELKGYVATSKNNVIYPSIALNDSGNGSLVFTLVGKEYYPSAAYITFSAEDGASKVIHIAKSGAGPEDGFSGYAIYDLLPYEIPARWGDYSAASSDGNNVWFATEYIPNACTTLTAPCRTALANWGTFVARLSGDREE